jgi:chemotaxis protein MotB
MRGLNEAEVTMGKWLLTIVLVLAAALGAAYWWLYRPQEASLAKARAEAASCSTQIRSLRTEIADLQAVHDELLETSATLSAQVAAKEKELAALRSTHDELIGELKQEIADKQVEVERVRDKLRVEMVDEVLFDSGEAQLKPAGIAVLKKIGGVLAKSDRGIEVQGHTDNVPIHGALAKRFATNWELSAARAINVARFFQDQTGIAPERLSATARSEYEPRDTNETPEGRRRNRRIEILLVPTEAGKAKPAVAADAEPAAAAEAPAEPEKAAATDAP